MKRACYTLLALFAAAMLVTPAIAFDMKGNVHHQAPANPREIYQCDDGFLDNAYFENQGYAYGNAFNITTPGPLSTISYWHHGWFTLFGPYAYNVHVFDDATCTPICVIGPLEAADAYDHDEFEVEDLCDFQCAVTGNTIVAVEPLSCSAPNDCYPDVYFDQTGVFDGCDRILNLAAPDCSPQLNGDFVLQITVDECQPSPVQTSTWGHLKSIYR